MAREAAVDEEPPVHQPELQRVDGRLRQQFADDGHRLRLARHFVEHPLCALLPFIADGIDRGDKDEQDEDARHHHVRQIDVVVERGVAYWMAVDGDGLQPGHHVVLTHALGPQLLAEDGQADEFAGGLQLLHQQVGRHQIAVVGIERHAGLARAQCLTGGAGRYVEETVDVAPPHGLVGLAERAVLIADVGQLHGVYHAAQLARGGRVVGIHHRSGQTGGQSLPHERREEQRAGQRRNNHHEEKHRTMSQHPAFPPCDPDNELGVCMHILILLARSYPDASPRQPLLAAPSPRTYAGRTGRWPWWPSTRHSCPAP